MGGNRRTAERKRKAKHYSLMVSHAKKAFQKKRIEAFQRMVEEQMPKATQHENVVDTPDVSVDLDDVIITSDEEPKSEVKTE